jgi:hypothetical protein
MKEGEKLLREELHGSILLSNCYLNDKIMVAVLGMPEIKHT